MPAPGAYVLQIESLILGGYIAVIWWNRCRVGNRPWPWPDGIWIDSRWLFHAHQNERAEVQLYVQGGRAATS